MKPGHIIQVKADKRYKVGNIKKVKGVLRGHPETMHVARMDCPNGEMSLNPPIVVSHELGEAIRKASGIA